MREKPKAITLGVMVMNKACCVVYACGQRQRRHDITISPFLHFSHPPSSAFALVRYVLSRTSHTKQYALRFFEKRATIRTLVYGTMDLVWGLGARILVSRVILFATFVLHIRARGYTNTAVAVCKYRQAGFYCIVRCGSGWLGSGVIYNCRSVGWGNLWVI